MAPERVANKIMGSDELREVLADAVNEYYKNIDMKVCFCFSLFSVFFSLESY